MRLRLNAPIVIQSVRVELIGPADLRLAGSITDEVTWRELGFHLRDLHAHVVKNKLKTLTVDVRGLAFVNSSAIRLFVDLASGAESAGYTLVFDVDSSITWHRLSFSVLKSLAPHCVVLRSGGQVIERLGS